MSQKREKARRANQKLEYIAAYNKWLSEQPPMWRFFKWRRWKSSCPSRMK